jgi:hypothetical protein
MFHIHLSDVDAFVAKALKENCRIAITRCGTVVPIRDKNKKNRVIFQPAIVLFYRFEFPRKNPTESWSHEETVLADDEGHVDLKDTLHAKWKRDKGAGVPDFYLVHRAGSID